MPNFIHQTVPDRATATGGKFVGSVFQEKKEILPGGFQLVGDPGKLGNVIGNGNLRQTEPGKDLKIAGRGQIGAGKAVFPDFEFDAEKGMENGHPLGGDMLDGFVIQRKPPGSGSEDQLPIEIGKVAFAHFGSNPVAQADEIGFGHGWPPCRLES